MKSPQKLQKGLLIAGISILGVLIAAELVWLVLLLLLLG